LTGKLIDKDTKEVIKLSEEIETKLPEIYTNRLIPLFGEYNETGLKIRKGKVDFIESKKTPSQMKAYIQNHAKQNGRLVKDDDGNIISYQPNNPNKYTIIITDHVRKILREKGKSIKETVDDWISATVEIRNITGYS